eukprot:2340889-Rhodomonas_salina.1
MAPAASGHLLPLRQARTQFGSSSNLQYPVTLQASFHAIFPKKFTNGTGFQKLRKELTFDKAANSQESVHGGRRDDEGGNAAAVEGCRRRHRSPHTPRGCLLGHHLHLRPAGYRFDVGGTGAFLFPLAHLT